MAASEQLVLSSQPPAEREETIVERATSVSNPIYDELDQAVLAGRSKDYWDPAIPEINEKKSSSWHDRIIKFFKGLTIVLIFLVLLGCTMLSKSTVLLATAQLRRNPTLYCKTDIGDINRTYCITSPVVSKGDNRTMDLYCLDKGEGMKDIAATERDVCQAVTIRWIWCLICMMWTPYIFVIVRCCWYACLRKVIKPSLGAFLWVCVLEVLYCIGLCLLVFRVLPHANGFTQSIGLMSGVAMIPGFLRLFNRQPSQKNRFCWCLVGLLDILAFASQVSAVIVLPILMSDNPEEYDENIVWLIIPAVSVFLISLPWWEQYVHKDTWLFGICHRKTAVLKEELKESRNFSYLIASFLKMVVTLIMAMLIGTKEPSLDIFRWGWDAAHCGGTVGPAEISSMRWDWLSVWGINAAAGLLAYFLARIAVKIKMQIVSYTIPLLLTTPFVLGSLTGMCEMWNQDPCRYTNTIPGHVFWQCYPRGGLVSLYTDHYLWLILLWYISLFWIGRHIFRPSTDILLHTDRIFTLPLYDGIAVTEWLVFNRSRKHEKQKQVGESADQNPRRVTNIPLVHACITMWHETLQEMQTLLNSVFKLDEYQSRPNEDEKKIRFQVNIYFDQPLKKTKGGLFILNDFVKDLITSINKVSAKHGRAIHPSKKMRTPYGGRLVWTMPHGTKIVLHLKDDKKIKAKKRWSQVMYMYELINFDNSTPISGQGVLKDVENTFLLALDGDVDFKPEAVLKLVDVMRNNKRTAAVCGRIHPLGSGPMVWYQKFEYALGHWMQKATEHVLGCVLCSPGCFSLFRASALRQVLHTYTAHATEAKHFIQYDQGEDRWLNTLLLKMGYNVEYSAASDCSTFVPEMLGEFFNQRRRWLPSTTANILDLLLSWKIIIRNENKISKPYMLYQAMLFALSLVGGGTIFLMIVGALQVALHGAIDQWTSLIINAIPILLYIVICIKGNQDTQAMASMVLTAIYALMQALVFVGITVQISKDGICSPTGTFFVFVAVVFITAACLHPQEFTCVIYGIIYFLAIPSMYMLLTIYSVLNLNIMSWGTREAKTSSKQTKGGPAKGLAHIDTQHGCMLNIGDACMILCCAKPDTATVDINATEAHSLTEEPAVVVSEETAHGGATAVEGAQPQNQEDYCWTEDPYLEGVDEGGLDDREEKFYEALIKKYLRPEGEAEKKEEEAKMKEKLKTLRNIVAGSYFIVNAIFVIIIFTLQANVDNVSVPWPCGESLRLEPIGFTFLIFFGLVMVLQTIGMVVHRTSTFLHIIATTPLWESKSDKPVPSVDNSRGERNHGFEWQRIDMNSTDTADTGC